MNMRVLLWIQLTLIPCSTSFLLPLHSNPPLKTPLHSTEASSSAEEVDDADKKPHHVVIVGGGWAGFSAADALARSKTDADDDDIQITLLDASPRGKGGLAGGWRTPQGRPVEAGIHGFWREYRNTFAVLDRLGLDVDDVLTPYTPSVLFSSSGKVAVAPVLKEDNTDDDKQGGSSTTTSSISPLLLAQIFQSAVMSNGREKSTSDALKPLAALLPVPLDLALLAEYDPSSPLNTADRISALGLLGAWADFGQEDSESWKRYDSISAEDLFLKKAGVTQTLYEELVLPLLHVLPMCPGYDCSAAAALSCFHVFALQSQGAFDVRWCRGAIAESIFNPWAEQLAPMVNVQGSSKVSSINKVDSGFELKLEKQSEPINCDSVIMAVGGTAMGRLAPASSAFSNIPIEFEKNRGVTCVAVRVFLKPHSTITSGLKGGQHDSTEAPPEVAKAMKDSPVAVCGPAIGNVPELKETGFCIYDLQRLQNEFAVDAGNDNRTAVLEVDFFRADAIADITDDNDVAALALKAIAATFNTATIPMDDVVEVAVVRARNAVSHFAINSASYSPPVKLSEEGLYMCGDWIDRSGHASWSTEKAVVTGRQAAQAVLEDIGLRHSIDVIPAAPDTAPLQALRKGARILRSVAPPPGDGVPPSPWSFVREVLQGSQS